MLMMRHDELKSLRYTSHNKTVGKGHFIFLAQFLFKTQTLSSLTMHHSGILDNAIAFQWDNSV